MAFIAWALDGGSYGGADLRLSTGASFVHSDATLVRNGVIPAPNSPMAVTLGAGAFDVVIAPGQAVVRLTEAGKVGPVVCTNTTSATLTVGGPSASFDRIDLIVARVYDEGSAARHTWTPEVVPGTASASGAVPPAAPVNTTALAQILVPTGATRLPTTAVTDRRVYTAAVGGVIPVLSTAARPSAYPGLTLLETDTRRLYVYDGTTFQPLVSGVLYSNFLTSQGTVAFSPGTSVGCTPAITVPTFPFPVEATVSYWGDVVQTVPGDEWRVDLWVNGGASTGQPVPAGSRGGFGAGIWHASFSYKEVIAANTSRGYQPVFYRQQGSGVANLNSDIRYNGFQVTVRAA